MDPLSLVAVDMFAIINSSLHLIIDVKLLQSWSAMAGFYKNLFIIFTVFKFYNFIADGFFYKILLHC